MPGQVSQCFPEEQEILAHLLLKIATNESPVRALQFTLKELIHSESDSLTGSNTHHTGSNTLVESASALRLEHILGDDHDTGDSRLTGLSTGLLKTGLDGVNGSVGEGADGTGDQTNQGGLVSGQLAVAVFWLPALQASLQFRVCGEVGSLVGSLSEGCQGDTAVQNAEAFFLDHGEQSVRGTAVLRGIQGVSQTVVLGLQTNFDDFHRVDNGHGFGNTGGETSCGMLALRCTSFGLFTKLHVPRKVALLVTAPVCLSASMPLYDSYEVNRMAIFGMIPPSTAPRPLYRPRAVSFCTI